MATWTGACWKQGACRRRYLFLGVSGIRIAKLAESPLYLSRQVACSLAIPAQVGLVEGRAVERGHQVAACGIAAIRLALRQFLGQERHPTAQGTQKAPADVRLFKHQPQHLFRLAGVVHLLPHHGEYGVFQRCQWFAALGRFGKALCDALPKLLHAEGKQLFLATEVAEKGAPGDAGVAADLLDRSPVEADGSEQFPRGPFNFLQNELMFPLAKRPGILSFRPLFSTRRENRFLHCMQIMAQSAVL
jgi:hypothetical protein